MTMSVPPWARRDRGDQPDRRDRAVGLLRPSKSVTGSRASRGGRPRPCRRAARPSPPPGGGRQRRLAAIDAGADLGQPPHLLRELLRRRDRRSPARACSGPRPSTRRASRRSTGAPPGSSAPRSPARPSRIRSAPTAARARRSIAARSPSRIAVASPTSSCSFPSRTTAPARASWIELLRAASATSPSDESNFELSAASSRKNSTTPPRSSARRRSRRRTAASDRGRRAGAGS